LRLQEIEKMIRVEGASRSRLKVSHPSKYNCTTNGGAYCDRSSSGSVSCLL
jgi:hypothetical protein